jgi:hypothetical protein
MSASKTILAIATLLMIATVHHGQSNFNVYGGSKVTLTAATYLNNEHLNIHTASQMVNRGKLTVDGVLINYAGTAGLVLKADKDGYGSLMHTTPLVQASVEQYLSSMRWHLITPPVQSENIEPYLNIYLKQWEEPTATWTYLISPLSTPIEMFRGYSAWAANDLTDSTTVVLEGTLKAGNGLYPGLSYSNQSPAAGWNLIGNPYPSAVEWNTNWFLNDVGGWAVVYENGIYKGWNPWLPEGEQSYNGKSDGFIAPTQGFWVRTTGSAPYLQVPQSARGHYAVDFMKSKGESTLLSLRLLVSANGFTDEAAILFLEGATSGFDGLYDLEKHMNVSESPNIYCIGQNDRLIAVNVLQANWISQTGQTSIPLGFQIDPVSNCTLTAAGIEKFSASVKVFLEDKKLNIIHDLSQNPVYEFAATGSDDPQRFLLHFGATHPISNDPFNEILIYGYGSDIYVKVGPELQGEAFIYDIMGRLIKNVALDGAISKIAMSQSGNYIVLVRSDNILRTDKIFLQL